MNHYLRLCNVEWKNIAASFPSSRNSSSRLDSACFFEPISYKYFAQAFINVQSQIIFAFISFLRSQTTTQAKTLKQINKVHPLPCKWPPRPHPYHPPPPSKIVTFKQGSVKASNSFHTNSLKKHCYLSTEWLSLANFNNWPNTLKIRI